MSTTTAKSTFVKRTLRFPGNNVSNVFAGASAPADPQIGSFMTVGSGGTIIAPSGANGWTSADTVAQKVSLPSSNGDLPLSAIGLSPDSAISECFISFGGGNSDSTVFRVSAGNPAPVPVGTDFMWVYPSTGMPVLDPAQSGDGAGWDAVIQPGAQSTIGSQAWGWPLRLLLMYGEIVQMAAIRSPYYASVVALVPGSGASRMLFCIEGRSKVLLSFSGNTVGDITLSANFIWGRPNATFPLEESIVIWPIAVLANASPTAAVGNGTWSNLESPSGLTTPAPILQVNLSNANVAQKTAYIRVYAFDHG